MPTLVAYPWRSVEALQPGRVPTGFGPTARLRRPKSQRDQRLLATPQAEMCLRTANSGLATPAPWRPPGTRTAGLIRAGLTRLLCGVGPPALMLAIARKSDRRTGRH